MENTIKVKDQWAEKYIKDNIWYPFGSLIGAWATIKQQDPNYTLEKFLTDSKEIYDQAKDNVIKTYRIYKELEITKEEDKNSPDIPTT